jgi:hypothetical protein
MLTLRHAGVPRVPPTLTLSLLKSGPFGPHRLLNDADATRMSTAVHTHLHHILLFSPPTTHLTIVLSPFIIPYVYPLIFLFWSTVFLIKGFMFSPSPFVHIFPRDTCCCVLPLCRITEFLSLSNLLTRLAISFPLSLITSSHNPRPALPLILIVHVRFLHVGSQLLSSPNTCTPAFNFRERQESFTVRLVSAYPGTHKPHQSTTVLSHPLPHGFFHPSKSPPPIDADHV